MNKHNEVNGAGHVNQHNDVNGASHVNQHNDDPNTALLRMRAVARTRWRLAGALTAAMIVVYFGFLALVAWAPQLLAQRVTDGLSLGVLLGALVIVAAWLLTWVYVRWANLVYDPMVAEQRAALASAKKASEQP